MGIIRQGGGALWLSGLTINMPVLACIVFALVISHPVEAADFSCPAGDVTCLIAAINTANGNGEDDTITLAAGTYTLTAVDNTTDGDNGLPSITSPITIQGAGAETTILERATTALKFHLLHVSPGGVLQIEGLTVRGGFSEGGSGGGILNAGAVTIAHAVVADNVAVEGAGLANGVGAVTITNTTFARNSDIALDR
jgi:hypothetical protein